MSFLFALNISARDTSYPVLVDLSSKISIRSSFLEALYYFVMDTFFADIGDKTFMILALELLS